MASISHSSVALGGSSASDFLRGSCNGVSGISLKTLGRAKVFTRRKDLSVTARLRKVKKFEYPWPENPDPNVKGGILTYLSTFKPLNDRPKMVTLEFEKPLLELEKKIVGVRKMADETGLDFTDQIISLENKYRQAIKDLYTHLTPIQRVHIARHPNRPTFLDHVFNITDKFVELHGDRAGYDDPAIVTGIGTIDGKRYMFIGHQKGRNTKENIERNFGMPTPHGYRKALRMMYYADHHGFPIVTFIDTPGAYADLKSEELGQGEAIANNLRTMFGLKVPILSIVIGEGGSGGALAIGCANKMLMLENAVFYVASPEACAAILWKDSKAAPEAAEKLRITSRELVKLQVADGIVPEPLGGAHADPSWTAQQIKIAINDNMEEFSKMSGEELLKQRMLKYRKIGVFIEGTPIEPKRKFNMKKKDVVSTSRELEGEVEKLKEQILKAKETTSSLEEEPSPEILEEMIEKLKSEIDDEYTEATKAMGLEERLKTLRQEFSKASSEEHLMHPVLIDKIEKLKEEFNNGLAMAPNYDSLRSKLTMLKDLSRAKAMSEAASLKKEINRRFREIAQRPENREKVEAIKAEIESSGISRFEELPEASKEKIAKIRAEIESEMMTVLRSMGCEVKNVKPNPNEQTEQALVPSEDVQDKVETLNLEIAKKIDEVVKKPDIKNMIELLKVEIAKAGNTPEDKTARQKKIETMEQQIKQRISEALSDSELREKQEEIEREIAGSNVSFKGDDHGYSEKTEVKSGASSSSFA
ncbi:PREDICTED: acetyl-coenzyme A carboxylase carboxyl transferase subunit alpha, chloroplastic-like [Tarenaya hassleriana]|uniref:acetyl-coenzyme A carboxylase carboxyl transferase subunit alpha, chloroplastic-like n=1 Tax=Tarenaya hassleriana TaxID=28532 RepID=UPI00053C85E0|nr:PREDICTED: acetyl-coenzyme A carboxylase carboxyl transferase subunit alpha, chloroplastic-like [Tarenaya hassleriana]XP_010529774.1 PREDICTED: acetyl-coenzyme A carboxylase carboxyl transferase subunit alpha, chloroplastic-like [Tarenaya hassleriana]